MTSSSCRRLTFHLLSTRELRIWFEHYKGLDNKMKFVGYAEKDEAIQLLNDSHKAFDPARKVEGH